MHWRFKQCVAGVSSVLQASAVCCRRQQCVAGVSCVDVSVSDVDEIEHVFLLQSP